MNVIDLFAGCGGFSLGFEMAGFKISKAVEIDKSIANTYAHNHPNTKLFVEDIGNIDNEDYFSINESEVIIGGPPCQGFSMAGDRIRTHKNFVDDPRNYLFKHYLNVLKIVLPQFFVFENVKGILTMQNGLIFNEILNEFSNKQNFKNHSYNVVYKIINSSDFGIPQNRQRVIIIGVRDKSFDFDYVFNKTKETILSTYPHFFDKVTIWDAISNLNSVEEVDKIENQTPLSEYQNFLYAKDFDYLYNHTKTKHNEKSINRIKKIHQGDNWQSLDENIHSVHSGSYGRLEQYGLSPTITTRFDTPSGGRFIHPLKDRTLTPREAARIQSFPDYFRFYGSKTSICKQIGNAVPIKLAYFLANFIKTLLNNE